MRKINKIIYAALIFMLIGVFLCPNSAYSTSMSMLRVPSIFFSKQNPDVPYSYIKCIVLDCDEILWEGTVGEDGIDGIRLKPEHLELQRKLKEAKEKGVVLAINSKNNIDDVEEVFKKRSDMILKREDFAVVKANWQNKAANLKEISEELNIGLDSLFFIDDNPREIKLARQVLSVENSPFPGVSSKRIIEKLNEICSQRIVTDEDRRKTELYAEKKKRDEQRKEAISLEDFYRSLRMNIIIGEDDENLEHIHRMVQLTQKTSQFNLTTHRYSEEEMRGFLKNPNYKTFTLRAIDQYGDLGIVGLIILKRNEGRDWEIDTFCLSCRAIGYKIEHAFILYVTRRLKEEDAENLIGVYMPTKKNILVENLYNNLGFSILKKEKDRTYWKKELKTEKPEESGSIRIIEKNKLKAIDTTCEDIDKVLEALKKEGALIIDTLRTGEDIGYYGREAAIYYRIYYLPSVNFGIVKYIYDGLPENIKKDIRLIFYALPGHDLYDDIDIVREAGVFLDRYLRIRYKTLGLASIYDYFDFIKSGSEDGENEKRMLRYIIEGMSNYARSSTEFYRFGQSDLLEFLPGLIHSKVKNKDLSIRVKSLGVSSGEEPYSAAFSIYYALRDYFKNHQDEINIPFNEWLSQWDIAIEAYDINLINLFLVKAGRFDKYWEEPNGFYTEVDDRYDRYRELSDPEIWEEEINTKEIVSGKYNTIDGIRVPATTLGISFHFRELLIKMIYSDMKFWGSDSPHKLRLPYCVRKFIRDWMRPIYANLDSEDGHKIVCEEKADIIVCMFLQGTIDAPSELEKRLEPSFNPRYKGLLITGSVQEVLPKIEKGQDIADSL